MYKTYEQYLNEDKIQELIGFLKGKYDSIADVKKCNRFKKLSKADKEYVIDELKSDGMK